MNTKEIKKLLIDTGHFIDNKYLDKYCNLIFSNIDNKLKYYEKHHVVPKCASKNDWIVMLPIELHFLAHFYLSKCCDNIVKKDLDGATNICLKRCKNTLRVDKKKMDYSFYNMVNSYLLNGFSFKDINEFIKQKKHYTTTRYLYICKKYNLENKNKTHWSENKAKEFYDKVNYWLINGLTFREIDIQLNLSKRYSGKNYYLICHRFNWPNKNPRQKRK